MFCSLSVLYFSLVARERGVNKKVTRDRPSPVDSKDVTGWLDGMDQPFQGHWLGLDILVTLPRYYLARSVTLFFSLHLENRASHLKTPIVIAR